MGCNIIDNVDNFSLHHLYFKDIFGETYVNRLEFIGVKPIHINLDSIINKA